MRQLCSYSSRLVLEEIEYALAHIFGFEVCRVGHLAKWDEFIVVQDRLRCMRLISIQCLFGDKLMCR